MKRVFNKSWFDFERKDEFRDVLIVSGLAFLIPLLLGRLIELIFGAESLITSNLLVIIGTIINSLLIVSALNFKGLKNIIPVIVLPSWAIVLSGLLFGYVSSEMAWMLIGIWIANYFFVYLFKKLMIEKKYNYFLTGLIAIIAKSLIIFGVFSLLNACNVFSSNLVNDLKYIMGSMQILTGVLGVLLGYLIYTSYKYE